jgi:hypothetical protein
LQAEEVDPLRIPKLKYGAAALLALVTGAVLITGAYSLAMSWRTTGMELPDNEAEIYFSVLEAGSTGTLVVTIEPEEAGADGAQWSADGRENWHDSGFVLPLEAGDYTVTFKILAGWDAPADLPVRVESNETAQRTAFYTPWYGDINRDENVDVSDAILLLRQIVGLIDITLVYGEGAALRADVNGDGHVDVSDAILILRYIVGLVKEFPIP